MIAASALHAVAALASSFTVTYAGSGSSHTVYRSTPPNPGGMHDTDSAHDSETQKWSLRFAHPLRIPACQRQGKCSGRLSLAGATGTTQIVGRIDHVHIDGLYPQLNASIRCTIRPVPAATAEPDAAIGVSYTATQIAITALDPVQAALLQMPTACPNQGGDSIDGLNDNYLGPGFSFDPRYGPDRWFTSARIVISRKTLAHARTISIHVSQTPRGTPPRGCEPSQPSYEHCTTAGSWSGVLTLRNLSAQARSAG